jgi:hypothetical protein
MPAPSAFHFFRLEAAADPAAYADGRRYFEHLGVCALELRSLRQRVAAMCNSMKCRLPAL